MIYVVYIYYYNNKQVSMLTFLTYVMVDPNNVLTADKVFPAIALFNILNMPLGILPLLVVYIVQVKLR